MYQATTINVNTEEMDKQTVIRAHTNSQLKVNHIHIKMFSAN